MMPRPSVPLLLAALAWTPLTQAAPITDWSYSITTQFTGNNVFSPGGGTQTQEAIEVSWGAPGGSVFGGDTGNPFENRSGITLNDQDASGEQDPDLTPRTGNVATNATGPGGIGTGSWITHHNNPIPFATLLSSQIAFDLTLNQLQPPGPGVIGPVTLPLTIFFAETPNAAPCVAVSPVPCNDIFAVNPAEAFNRPFLVDGNTYFVSTFPVLAGSFQPLTAAECAATGAQPGCVGFTTVERERTTVQFGFRVTSAPIGVNEPAHLALLGLGVLGLAMRLRGSS
jgi:hypothetical protein